MERRWEAHGRVGYVRPLMRAAMFDETMRERLREVFPGNVLFDEPLSRHTSMGVGGKADAVAFPRTREELKKGLHCLAAMGISCLPLGNGTNLIVRDGGYRGVVISLKGMPDWDMDERDSSVLVHAGAGKPLAELITLSLKEGLTGMEFCAGIPGTVGGAVRMNAGAYGREMKDVVETVTFIGSHGTISSHRKEELKFSYRNLEAPPDVLILSATFTLSRGDRKEVRERIENLLALRRDKHPLMYRNAGSIFKNPRGESAGRIIEEMGMKGLAAGDAKISELHGNFIVNTGKATAADILDLIERVKHMALKKKGIVLETEVHIVGDDL